jgi:hypothetical protein
MRSHNFSLVTVAICAALLAGACSRSTQPVVPDDNRITGDIQSKLFQDSMVKSRDIHIDAKSGAVNLTGTVNSDDEKAEVERVVRQVNGVTQVNNQLAVQPPADSGAATQPLAAPQESTAESTPEPKPRRVTIPAGTVVAVRTIDPIDTKINQPGQTFAASLSSPVVVRDRVIFRQGSDATLRLVSASQSGRFRGTSQMEVELVSVTVRGVRYPIQSSPYAARGASRGKRTAETVGGAAVVGGLIGALAGGRKGLAIGAGVGAGGGTGLQAFRHGDQVKIPSESKIDFALTAPVKVRMPSAKE